MNWRNILPRLEHETTAIREVATTLQNFVIGFVKISQVTRSCVRSSMLHGSET